MHVRDGDFEEWMVSVAREVPEGTLPAADAGEFYAWAEGAVDEGSARTLAAQIKAAYAQFNQEPTICVWRRRIPGWESADVRSPLPQTDTRNLTGWPPHS